MPFRHGLRELTVRAVQRGASGPTRQHDGSQDFVYIDPVNVRDELRRADDTADAPADHTVLLRHRADGDGAFGHAGQARGVEVGPAVEQYTLHGRVVDQLLFFKQKTAYEMEL